MDQPFMTWRQVRKALLLNMLVWLSLCVVGAASVYSDVLRDGGTRTYGTLLGYWVSNHVLLMLFSFALHLALRRWPSLTASARVITHAYAMVLCTFLPLQLVYLAMLDEMRAFGVGAITLAGIWQRVLAPQGFNVFLEFAWTTGTFAAVTALSLWRASQARERAWRQAQTENLRLSLELERHRMLALRGQLEPHFIFNALNAISALVRTGDEDLALTGINRLSDLLRYALTASGRDWVTVTEELAFVRDYLALQRLRYGGRLQVRLVIDDDAVAGAECPPLLLQPLIENALRHDLDCHAGDGDIRIAIRRDGGQLHIRISNPRTRRSPPNPGLGLGLANTRARLQLAYRNAATLHSAALNDRFEVEIRMPLQALE